jgi:hypothetical protein
VLDPLHGDAYQFWSGFGGAFVPPIVFGIVWFFWPTRCQELGCRRRAVTRHKLNGLPVCARHDEAEVSIAEEDG